MWITSQKSKQFWKKYTTIYVNETEAFVDETEAALLRCLILWYVTTELLWTFFDMETISAYICLRYIIASINDKDEQDKQIFWWNPQL